MHTSFIKQKLHMRVLFQIHFKHFILLQTIFLRFFLFSTNQRNACACGAHFVSVCSQSHSEHGTNANQCVVFILCGDLRRMENKSGEVETVVKLQPNDKQHEQNQTHRSICLGIPMRNRLIMHTSSNLKWNEWDRSVKPRRMKDEKKVREATNLLNNKTGYNILEILRYIFHLFNNTGTNLVHPIRWFGSDVLFIL